METSIEQQKSVNVKCFETMEEFRDSVIDHLKKGYPILVESVYYGGHYQVIIGYDKRSKVGFLNDILIFADSSDETDDYMDGYTYFSAFKFLKCGFYRNIIFTIFEVEILCYNGVAVVCGLIPTLTSR